MSVIVYIESITFPDKSPPDSPDLPASFRFADVVVLVSGFSDEPIKFRFRNRRVDSLDKLTEALRSEISRFADDLAEAAKQPLR